MVANFKNTDTQNIAMLIAQRTKKPVDVRWMTIEGMTVHPNGKIEWTVMIGCSIYAVVKDGTDWVIESHEEISPDIEHCTVDLKLETKGYK